LTGKYLPQHGSGDATVDAASTATTFLSSSSDDCKGSAISAVPTAAATPLSKSASPVHSAGVKPCHGGGGLPCALSSAGVNSLTGKYLPQHGSGDATVDAASTATTFLSSSSDDSTRRASGNAVHEGKQVRELNGALPRTLCLALRVRSPSAAGALRNGHHHAHARAKDERRVHGAGTPADSPWTTGPALPPPSSRPSAFT